MFDKEVVEVNVEQNGAWGLVLWL